MSVSIEPTETRTMRCPLHEIAPHIQTGTKLPYNMKIIRGKITFVAGTTVYRLLDIQTDAILALDPNTIVICAGLYTVSPLTGGNTFDLGLSVTDLGTALPVFTNALTSSIPVANINAGCAVKYGTIGGADQTTCIGYAANLTNGTVPVIRTNAGGGGVATAGSIHVTLLAMSIIP